MDFKFIDNSSSVAFVSDVSSKDHNDIHYLYKLRKALVLLVGEDNLSGLNESQLKDFHTAIVRNLSDHDKAHWYETYNDDLDDFLPEDLKKASEGYFAANNSSIFDLEEEEVIYIKMLEENGAIDLWTAPEKRDKIPSSHFLDQKNKKYPYKNSDGTINCMGLKTAIAYAGGARGASKRPDIKAKAKKVYTKNCESKKNELITVIGKLIKA